MKFLNRLTWFLVGLIIAPMMPFLTAWAYWNEGIWPWEI